MKNKWLESFMKALFPVIEIGNRYTSIGMWSIPSAIIFGSIFIHIIFGTSGKEKVTYKSSLISALIPSLIIATTIHWLGAWSLLLALVVSPLIENSLLQTE